MANINDPVTAVGAKVSAAGAIHITAGGDGFPTFLVRLGSARVTTAIGAGAFLWGLRAPANKTLDLRAGDLGLSFDGTAAAGTALVVELTRFSGADPAGGTLVAPTMKVTSEGQAQTVAVREAASAAAVTLTGATVQPANQGIFTLGLPLSATGVTARLSLADLTGLTLAPGEGVCIRALSAVPVGSYLTGYLEFSER